MVELAHSKLHKNAGKRSFWQGNAYFYGIFFVVCIV